MQYDFIDKITTVDNHKIQILIKGNVSCVLNFTWHINVSCNLDL